MAKSLRNRYSKSLEGLNAQGFFSPTGANTSSAAAATTLAAFINTAQEGQVAIFNAETNAAVAIAGALTAGTKYFIAQIVDGQLKKSVTFDGGNVELTGTGFDAPVLQSVAVGFNGVSGDLNIDIVGGLQEFVLRVNETTPANQPFPTIEGRAVVRTPNANDYDVASHIVADLNGQWDLEANEDEKAVEAGVIVIGATTAFTNAAATSGTAVKGQTLIVVDDAQDLVPGSKIVFAAAGANATATVYNVVKQNTGGTVESIEIDRPLLADVAAGTAVTKKDYDPTDTAKSSVGIIITAVAEDVVFSVGVSEDLAAADITTLTEWKQGSGAPWQVAAMEKETQVFAGETTQNIAFREDFGRPNSFVDGAADPATATNQYDLLFIKYRKGTPSMAYYHEYVDNFGYIILGTIGVATVLGVTF